MLLALHSLCLHVQHQYGNVLQPLPRNERGEEEQGLSQGEGGGEPDFLGGEHGGAVGAELAGAGVEII